MMNFRSSDDLILPFETIGEDGWDEGANRILEALAEEWGSDMAPPVSEEKLLATEERLGVKLPASLRLFLRRFGVADIGEELQDPDNMVPLAEWAADQDLEDFMTSEELALVADLVTFSEHLGIGNVVCFHPNEDAVYFFDHDTAPHLEKLFDSVDDYLKACLINVQDGFFDPSVRDAESQVEDELVRLFGEKTVVKWLY